MSRGSKGRSGPFPEIEAQGRAALEEARRLLKDAQASHGLTGPPFDPVRIADLLGIPVASSPRMRDWDALLIPGPKGFRILYNSAVRSAGRRRFSIAHEIAHTFFPEAEAMVQRRAKREDYHSDEEVEVERWCDRVAAELLMPQEMVETAIDDHGFDAAVIPAMAETFDVSLQASAVRYVETADPVCAVVFFDWMRRPSVEALPPGDPKRAAESPRYRVRRAFHSAGLRRSFFNGKSVPDESVVYRSSLGLRSRNADEEFETAAGKTARFWVSAHPLHRDGVVAGPPSVCAILMPGDLESASSSHEEGSSG